MRRFVLACSVMLTAGAAACANTATSPPDLVTIKGQLLRGSVPVANAAIYATDHFHVAASAGDASPFPGPSPAAFTDGTGRFYISGVGTSYDLTVVPPNSSDVTVVQNLTRRDPTITLPLPSDAPLHTCHVSLALTSPLPNGATVAYFLQGPAYPGVELVSLIPVDGSPAHGLTASWRGGVSTTANFWALVFIADRATGLPASYVGYASEYNWLIDQRDIGLTLSLQTMTTSSLSVQLQAPDGYSVDKAELAIDLGTGSTRFGLARFAAPDGTLSTSVPDMPFNRMLVSGTAKNGAATSTAAAITVATPDSTATATLTFPTAGTLIAPDEGATNVDSTTAFAWNGSGVSELLFSSATPNAPTIHVVTAEQSFSLAQFPALLLTPLPPNTPYTWSARHWPDFSATDAFEAAGIDLVNANTATSGPRRFTTKSP